MAFKLFRHKDSDIVKSYPEHYATHPIIGPKIEPYEPELDEYEEDKVVVENHELPLEQRITIKAIETNKGDDADEDKETD